MISNLLLGVLRAFPHIWEVGCGFFFPEECPLQFREVLEVIRSLAVAQKILDMVNGPALRGVLLGGGVFTLVLMRVRLQQLVGGGGRFLEAVRGGTLFNHLCRRDPVLAHMSFVLQCLGYGALVCHLGAQYFVVIKIHAAFHARAFGRALLYWTVLEGWALLVAVVPPTLSSSAPEVEVTEEDWVSRFWSGDWTGMWF